MFICIHKHIYPCHSKTELVEPTIQNFYGLGFVFRNFILNTDNNLFFPIGKSEETLLNNSVDDSNGIKIRGKNYT